MIKLLEQRFYSKVTIKDGCWHWNAHKSKSGYGRLTIQSKEYTAHRLSWMIHYGEIPYGLFVCHKCDNPSCTNPEHLFLGTAKDNAIDRNRKNRHRDDSGEKHPSAKLTNRDVIHIRRRLEQGIQGKTLAQEFGVSRMTISNIKTGRKWSSVQ